MDSVEIGKWMAFFMLESGQFKQKQSEKLLAQFKVLTSGRKNKS